MSSCVNNVGNFCDVYKPLYLSGAENAALSDDSDAVWRANNAYWLKHCK